MSNKKVLSKQIIEIKKQNILQEILGKQKQIRKY